MSETVSGDLRLVLIAALAWLHEHDMPEEGHAELLDSAINNDLLAEAVDRLSKGTV